MAAYKVTGVGDDNYTIVDSDLKIYKGKVEGDLFVVSDGKKAQIIGVLPKNFKRSSISYPGIGDLVVRDGNPDTELTSVLDVIEKRDVYELEVKDYIVLSNWK